MLVLFHPALAADILGGATISKANFRDRKKEAAATNHMEQYTPVAASVRIGAFRPPDSKRRKISTATDTDPTRKISRGHNVGPTACMQTAHRTQEGKQQVHKSSLRHGIPVKAHEIACYSPALRPGLVVSQQKNLFLFCADPWFALQAHPNSAFSAPQPRPLSISICV